MRREAVPEAEHDKDRERREKQSKEPDRVVADLGRAEQVPEAAQNHNRQRPEIGARAGGERGAELAQVEHEDGGIKRHVEDAGGEREPALLIAPEGREAAAHPHVKAALGGDGRGQLADHQRGGQTPEKRQQ